MAASAVLQRESAVSALGKKSAARVVGTLSRVSSLSRSNDVEEIGV